MRLWLLSLLLLALLPLPSAIAVERPPCPFTECGRVVATVDCLGHAVVAAAGESATVGPGDWLLVVDSGTFSGETYHNERHWDADQVSAFVDYVLPGAGWIEASLYYDGRLIAEGGTGCIGPV